MSHAYSILYIYMVVLFFNFNSSRTTSIDFVGVNDLLKLKPFLITIILFLSIPILIRWSLNDSVFHNNNFTFFINMISYFL